MRRCGKGSEGLGEVLGGRGGCQQGSRTEPSSREVEGRAQSGWSHWLVLKTRRCRAGRPVSGERPRLRVSDQPETTSPGAAERLQVEPPEQRPARCTDSEAAAWRALRCALRPVASSGRAPPPAPRGLRRPGGPLLRRGPAQQPRTLLTASSPAAQLASSPGASLARPQGAHPL